MLRSWPAIPTVSHFAPGLTSVRISRATARFAQLVEELLKHAPGRWEDRSDPQAVHEASKLNLAVDKAFHLLGWQPVWDFETTVEHTAKWYVRRGAGENSADLCDEHIAAYGIAARAKGLPWAG